MRRFGAPEACLWIRRACEVGSGLVLVGVLACGARTELELVTNQQTEAGASSTQRTGGAGGGMAGAEAQGGAIALGGVGAASSSGGAAGAGGVGGSDAMGGGDAMGGSDEGASCSNGCAGGAVCVRDVCVCPHATHACKGVCANDFANASCGTSCSPCVAPLHGATLPCDGLVCGFKCDPGFTGCGSACLDLQADGANCGVCGHDCLGGACNAGACQPVALVANQANPLYVAVNRTNLYWTLGDGNVMTQPISGGSPSALYFGHDAEGIAIDAAFVYWSTYNAGTILRMPLAGGPVTPLLTTDLRPLGVAVDATNLYFTSFDGALMQIPLTGGTPTTVVPPSTAFVAGVALNGTDAFFGNQSTLSAVPLAGGMTTAIVTGRSNVFGVAVDTTDVYWTDEYGGTVGKVSLAGGTSTTLISGFSAYAGGVAVDAKSIYWVASDSNGVGSIMRLAK